MSNGVGMEAELVRARKRTAKLVWACYFLLFVAAASPFIGYYDIRPNFEAREIWFQRSGSLTTIFALLSTTIMDLASRLLYSGGFGDKARLIVKREFEFRFLMIFGVGFFLTVVGTVIWGYGDTFLKIVNSPDDLATIFGVSS